MTYDTIIKIQAPITGSSRYGTTAMSWGPGTPVPGTTHQIQSRRLLEGKDETVQLRRFWFDPVPGFSRSHRLEWGGISWSVIGFIENSDHIQVDAEARK